MRSCGSDRRHGRDARFPGPGAGLGWVWLPSLDEYETRTEAGWHYHVALCLLAGAFLLGLQQDWGKRCSGSRDRRSTGWCGRCCPGNGSGQLSCCGGSRIRRTATKGPDAPMQITAPPCAHHPTSLPELTLKYKGADGVEARATTASFAWLHSRRSSVPTLTAAPTPSATTAMTPLPAVRGLKRAGIIWMNSTNQKGNRKSCAVLGNGLSGTRNWAWPGCYCCSPWPAPLRLPRLRQSPGYLPVLRLLMALPRPPGRRLLQRLPVHPKPRLKEPGKSKPRTTTRRTLPIPSSEAAEPVEAARRRPSHEGRNRRR